MALNIKTEQLTFDDVELNEGYLAFVALPTSKTLNAEVYDMGFTVVKSNSSIEVGKGVRLMTGSEPVTVITTDEGVLQVFHASNVVAVYSDEKNYTDLKARMLTLKQHNSASKSGIILN
jgi:hypothetical protein